MRFKLFHQFKYNLNLWQVYVDEGRPHILNKVTLSSQLMMNLSWQVVHHDAFVLRIVLHLVV